MLAVVQVQEEMWGKKYVYAGMTQFDLRKSQNEIQEHNNPTDAIYSFTTNFNLKQVRVQMKEETIYSPRRKITAELVLYDAVLRGTRQVLCYASSPNREAAGALDRGCFLILDNYRIAFWKLHFCLWKCLWLRWSLFSICKTFVNICSKWQ